MNDTLNSNNNNNNVLHSYVRSAFKNSVYILYNNY